MNLSNIDISYLSTHQTKYVLYNTSINTNNNMLKQTEELLNNIENCNVKTIKNNELFTSDDNIIKSLEFLCTKTSTLPDEIDKVIFGNIEKLEVYQLVYLSRFLCLLGNVLLRKNPWKLKRATAKLLRRVVLIHTYHCSCYSVLLTYKDRKEIKDLKITSNFDITHNSSANEIVDTFDFNELNMYFLYNSIDVLNTVSDEEIRTNICKLLEELEDTSGDLEEVKKMISFIREQHKELK